MLRGPFSLITPGAWQRGSRAYWIEISTRWLSPELPGMRRK